MKDYNSTLEEKVFAKFKSNELPHFIVIEPKFPDNSDDTLTWLNKTLCKCTDLKNLENSEDVLFMVPVKSQYSVEQIQETIKFLSYKPIRLKSKILVITHGDILKEIHFNKLLKTLEEPDVSGNIFLINRMKTTILDTITSRSIKIRYQNTKTESKELEPFKNFLEFEKYIQDNDFTSKDIFNLVTNQINTVSMNSSQINEMINTIKSIEKDLEYNNSAHSINTKLFHLLSSYNR